MSAWATLKNHYAALEAIQRDIAETGKGQDSNWKSQLIGLRRDLQDRIGLIREALKGCEAAGADPASCRALATELSRLRSAIATHQADWPAVMIDNQNPAYKASQARVRDASTAFHRAVAPLIEQVKG